MMDNEKAKVTKQDKSKPKVNIKEVFKDLKTKVKADKKLLFIIGIGIVGMLLLVITEFTSTTDDNVEKVAKATNKDTQYTYEQKYKCQIQSELQKLISSIDGAGQTKVMVTLDSGSKSVYAVDEKVDDNTDTQQGDTNYKKNNDYSRQTEHIIVNSSKDDEGLVIEVLQPKVRGVAVVCQGADSAMVRKDITDTVTAVLDIDSNRVCITKMIND